MQLALWRDEDTVFGMHLEQARTQGGGEVGNRPPLGSNVEKKNPRQKYMKCNLNIVKEFNLLFEFLII